MNGFQVERSTVVRAVMSGDPSERFDSILVRQLDSPEKFLRFLMLLLSLGGDVVSGGVDASLNSESFFGRSTEGLFELLVRALAAHPESIDRLSSIVDNLQKSGKSHRVLPEGWDQVWNAIQQARRTIERQKV